MTTPRDRSDSPGAAVAVLAVVAVLGTLAVLWLRAGGGEVGPAVAGGSIVTPAAEVPGAGEEAGARGAETDVPPLGDRRTERSGIELRGRVVGRDGRPVAGAILTLNGPGDVDHEAQTDANGAFVVRGMVAGSHQIIASGPHLLTHSEFARIGETSTPQEIEIVVDRGLPLTGQVQDDERRPVVGARVTPWRRGPSGEELDPRAAVTTDTSGRFQIWGSATGITFVFVEHEGFAPAKGRLEASRAGVVRLSRAK